MLINLGILQVFMDGLLVHESRKGDRNDTISAHAQWGLTRPVPLPEKFMALTFLYRLIKMYHGRMRDTPLDRFLEGFWREISKALNYPAVCEYFFSC